VPGQGVDEARVPPLHGSGVPGDQDHWRSASDDAVGDRAQLCVRGLHRRGGDRDRARNGSCRSRLRLRDRGVRERLHRRNRGRSQAGVGEIARVRPGGEQDKVEADLDSRDGEGPCVGRGCAGDPREGQGLDGGLGLRAGDGEGGRPAACQCPGEVLPHLLSLRADGQDLRQCRDRGAFYEACGRVRPSLRVGGQARQARRIGLHTVRVCRRRRPSGGQVGHRQEAALERGSLAAPPASRCQHSHRGEHDQRGSPGTARHPSRDQQASGTNRSCCQARARCPAGSVIGGAVSPMSMRQKTGGGLHRRCCVARPSAGRAPAGRTAHNRHHTTLSSGSGQTVTRRTIA